MKQEFLNRPGRYLCAFFITICFLLVLYGAEQGRRKMSNRVIDWLPSGFSETEQFHWFVEHFHEGDLLMISWDGCRLEDERAEKAADLLLREVDQHPPYFWKVITSGEIYRLLTSDPLNFTDEEAKGRMLGWILSEDEKQGAIVVYLSSEGYAHQNDAIEFLKWVIQDVTQLDESQIHMAGSSLDSVAIDHASKSSQKHLLPLFLAICVGALFLLLHSWLAVFAIFSAAIFNEELSCALIYYTGQHTDSVSLLSSSLLFVLTISGSLHLLNYYRDHLRQSGIPGAVTGAMRKAFLPCSLACLTTVLGLFSLTISKVVPIRRFGIFSSVTLIVGTAFFFFFIGSFIEQYPIRSWLIPQSNSEQSSIMEKFWDRFPLFVQKFRFPFAIISLLLFAFLCFCLPKLKTTITFHGMFPKNARVIQDYDYLENTIGGLVPVECVLSIPHEGNESLPLLNQLKLLDRIEQSIWEIDGVSSSLSALNFLPPLPEDGNGLRQTAARTAYSRVVENQLESLTNSCFVDAQNFPQDQGIGVPEALRWRISIRVKAQDRIAYEPFLAKVREVASQVIDENQKDLKIVHSSVLLTGGIPLAHKAQQQLLDDLTSSYLSAMVLILLTLFVLLRGVLPGTVAMIPNVFPSILVFGAMAYLGLAVDMGAMMTASVALGISVDGTIHFLTWFKHGMAVGLTRDEAVKFAYRQCGTAMVQATLICGCGMLVFTFSHFLPISRFAWMIAILLTIALYGDLVLLPSLLYTSIGNWFIPCNLKRILKKHSIRF